MRLTVCCTIAVALTMASCTVAGAQPRSRVDLEFGGWVLAGEPAVVMGATGWINDYSGGALRGIVVPQVHNNQSGGFRGFETLYQHRVFVGDFEIDLGAGLMVLTGETSVGAWSPTAPRDKWSAWFPRTDILVGRRLLKRLSVKAGLGTRTGGDYSDHIFRFTVVVPLGAL